MVYVGIDLIAGQHGLLCKKLSNLFDIEDAIYEPHITLFYGKRGKSKFDTLGFDDWFTNTELYAHYNRVFNKKILNLVRYKVDTFDALEPGFVWIKLNLENETISRTLNGFHKLILDYPASYLQAKYHPHIAFVKCKAEDAQSIIDIINERPRIKYRFGDIDIQHE
jgi:2'-5' RNA ligase